MYNKRIIHNQYVILDSPLDINIEKIEQTEDVEDDFKDKIRQAQEQAEEIIRQAQEQAEEIIRQAQEQAENEKLKIINDFKMEQQEKFEKELKNLNEEILDTVNKTKEYTDDYISLANEFIMESIKVILKKYINEEIFTKPQWINEILMEVRDKINSFNRIILRMNSDMVQSYGYLFENIKSESFTLKEDNTLSRNQINIETEIGTYDISPENYINQIMKTLGDSFNEST